jgi:Uncharacterized protein conserved in bacteria (DUF2325)
MLMALSLPHMLSTSVLQPAPFAPALARSELIRRDPPDPRDAAPSGEDRHGATPSSARRTRLWEFGTSLHCSIIGTCLTTAELRRVLVRLNAGSAEAASDHELHASAVVLASRREGGARFLHKALDRRHQVAISRYARARDPAALRALWQRSLEQGDIPGAYWAALTHPSADEDLIKRTFGDVHMLSHLVGAANRADIRRLRQLEQENAALLAKVDRQQRQLRDGFTARDQTIRRLNELLARQADSRTGAAAAPANDGTIDDVVLELNKRLGRESTRGDRMERRFNEASATLQARERALQTIRAELETADRELDLVETHLDALLQQSRPAAGAALDLSGLAVLYVGGRAHQIPRLRALVERVGGRFLHHDGGIEHASALLPSLVSRTDHVTFPVDCVSHEAVATIKKLCRQAAKPYQPLRTASLACLLSALAAIGQAPAETVAAE